MRWTSVQMVTVVGSMFVQKVADKIIGIDVGTTSVKVVVLSTAAVVRASFSVSYETRRTSTPKRRSLRRLAFVFRNILVLCCIVTLIKGPNAVKSGP